VDIRTKQLTIFIKAKGGETSEKFFRNKQSIKSHKKIIKELKKEIIQLEKDNNSHERINYLKNTILQGLDDLRYYNELLNEIASAPTTAPEAIHTK
jgi:DNA-binding transcriptional regulator GbsR (MarR family)